MTVSYDPDFCELSKRLTAALAPLSCPAHWKYSFDVPRRLELTKWLPLREPPSPELDAAMAVLADFERRFPVGALDAVIARLVPA